MTKQEKKKLLITTCLCLCPMIIGIIMLPKLPDQIAIHFNIHNEPDGFASKEFFAIYSAAEFISNILGKSCAEKAVIFTPSGINIPSERSTSLRSIPRLFSSFFQGLLPKDFSTDTTKKAPPEGKAMR